MATKKRKAAKKSTKKATKKGGKKKSKRKSSLTARKVAIHRKKPARRTAVKPTGTKKSSTTKVAWM